MPLDQVNVDDWELDENGQPQPPKEKEMSFVDHLEELRWHVMRSLIAIIIGGIVLFVFSDCFYKPYIQSVVQLYYLSDNFN